MHMRRLVIAGCLLLAGLVGDATGQALVGLPRLPAGPLLPTRAATDALGRVASDPLLHAPLDRVRRLQVQELLRTHHARVDLDPLGEPVLRGEFLLMSPDAATLVAVQAAGFIVQTADGQADPLDLSIAVLRDVRGRSARRAMQDLQRAAPGATFAYQHVYLPAGAAASAAGARTGAPARDGAGLRLGLVDGGVDASHRALSGVRVHSHGCANASRPQAHGTAVAVRLLGGGRGHLYAADLWCGDAVGRGTLGLVDALRWLARERVGVINISLVGPDNPVLARAVHAMLARGHVLVAAVGNDGPAAPPLYPAAYAGVIGVSGVDAKRRVLPESASGPHVDFSALGVAGPGARGTSFAAPVVARLAAGNVREPRSGAGADVERTLAAQAHDLGTPGRDARYGVGLVGAAH